jgi:hypothetical protein
MLRELERICFIQDSHSVLSLHYLNDNIAVTRHLAMFLIRLLELFPMFARHNRGQSCTIFDYGGWSACVFPDECL